MTPTSTYRVQVSPAFDLAATADLAGYLAALGVGCLYTSPLLAAMPGSTHGYDTGDHSSVNPEIGGQAGFDRLSETLTAVGLGLVVDWVPNHAGVAMPQANPAWWDVLANGRASAYARWFDIDFSVGRIRLPVLADTPDALDDLVVDGDRLRYFERCFPIAAGTGGGTAREIHDRQHYQLISWRLAGTELNYRRFFTISDLAGLRVEDPAVFEAVHAVLLRWYDEGRLAGVRIDHPDGLRDPGAYLAELARRMPQAWIVVEKILEPGEALPAEWPVAGSTGYDAMREVCALFVDPSAAGAFEAIETELTGRPVDWPAMVHDGKLAVATERFGAELRRLSRLVEGTPAAGAGPVEGVQAAGALVAEALAEVAACLEVYRCYPHSGSAYLDRAIERATSRRPDLAGLFDQLAPRLRGPGDELSLRFAQLSGAVMAKAVEDMGYYRWTRFVALNEVGGDPSAFGMPVAEFHAAAAARQRDWPASMTALSTHDTKRGEDVRARLAVLSEIPEVWAAAVRRWNRVVEPLDASVANLLWQTVVGAWPASRTRLVDYLVKASREASLRTSWEDPDPGFEANLARVVDQICAEGDLRSDIARFVERIIEPGWSNSLGQKLVAMAMPGIPDVYQGTELWEDSLVDPDNRRPVDFAARWGLLERIEAGWLPPVEHRGAAKLLLVSRLLGLRRARPELFDGYTPVQAGGAAAGHVVAFARTGVVAVATRLPVGLAAAGGWGDTVVEVPASNTSPLVDLLTMRPVEGGRVPVGGLLERYPVALICPADAAGDVVPRAVC